MEESTSRPWQPITHAIPVLLGEKNLEDWSVMVASTLRQMCLSKYIKSSVPEPDEEKDPKGWNKWNQEQGTVVTLLQSTLHKVRSTLTNAGLSVGEEDPYVIYNAVLKTIPKHSEDHIDQIAIRLANCKVADYSTLQAFRDDLQYMKRRLKELKLEPPEGFLLAIVLKKIEDVLPEMHAFARRDHKLGTLTWDNLMAEINSAIVTGTGNKAFSSFKKTAQTSTSSNASGGAQGGARQWPREDSLPSTGIVNGVKLPKSIIEKISYCCQCKRYLLTGWKHCEECGKCHGTSARGCRNNTQGQATQPISTNSSTTAGPTVFGGSSVAGKPATVAISALVENGKLSRDSIIADTGASETLFNDPKWFLDLVQLREQEAMESAAGPFKIEMAGTVQFDVVRDDGSVATITLEDARFSPSTPCNLISVGKLMARGYGFDGRMNHIVNTTNKKEVCQVNWKEGVPVLKAVDRSEPSGGGFLAKPAMLTSVTYKRLHDRFMHAGPAAIRGAAKRAGITIVKDKDFHCEPCLENRLTDMYGKHQKSKYNAPGQLIRFDLVEFKEGYNGRRYCLHFVDMDTNFHWVYFANRKHEAFGQIKEFVAFFERQSGRKIQALGCDNGPEFGLATALFKDSKLIRWANENGIAILRTIPHSPWMNGKAEKAGRDIVEKARTAHNAANLPSQLWPFTMEAACRVINLLPCTANEDNKAPIQLLGERLNLDKEAIPDAGFLRVVGSEVWIHVKKAYRQSSDKYAKTGIKTKLLSWDTPSGKIVWVYDAKADKVYRAVAIKIRECEDPPLNDPEMEEVEHVAEFGDTSIEDEFTTITTILEEANTLPTLQEPIIRLGTPIEDRETSDPQDQAPDARLNETPTEVPGPFQLPSPGCTPEPEIHTKVQGREGSGESQKNNPRCSPTNKTKGQRGVLGDTTVEERDTINQEEESVGGPSRVLPSVEDLPHDDIPQGVRDEDVLVEEEPIPRSRRPRSSTPQVPTREQPKRAAKGKNRVGLPDSSKGLGALAINATVPHDSHEPILESICLSALKVQHLIDTKTSDIPKNYKQAMQSPDFDKAWKPACDEGIAKLEENHTYDWSDPDPGANILPAKWVFDLKDDPEDPLGDKKVPRARPVICGNYETESWAMEDIYSAVASSTSIKLFMAFVAIKGLAWKKFDFVVAFLNSPIPEGNRIFVRPPPGYGRRDGKVWLMVKGMYGMRRSPLWWFETITPFLKDLGFEPFDNELCIFRNEKTGVLLILYVDDMLIAGPVSSDIDEVAAAISKRFNLKHLGDPEKFLGFNIKRDEENATIFLSQEEYTKKTVKLYGFESTKLAKTPWPAGLELPKDWEPMDEETKMYQKRTGALNWLSTGTRPDITYTVNKVAKGNVGPSAMHLRLQKHLFRYLERFPDLGIVINGKMPLNNIIKAYADASFGDDLSTRRSTAGYVVFVAGAPVLWKSKVQNLVTLSTTEAEFVNLTPAGQALLWVWSFLKEFGIHPEKPLLLFTDSLNAKYNVLNRNNAARTRHIDIRYKWVVEKTKEGNFSIQHVGTEEMAADGLTKPLEAIKHSQFVQALGLKRCSIY